MRYTFRYSIVLIFWLLWIPDLHTTYQHLSNSQAIGLTGTATGCVFFIPLALRYGRRPIYIVSLTVMAAMCLWQALMTSVKELYAISLITGLAGATNETIVQMTVCLLYFTSSSCHVLISPNVPSRSPTSSSFINAEQPMPSTW